MARHFALLAAALVTAPLSAQTAEAPVCKLCSEAREPRELAPLAIEVENTLAFSRMASLGSGAGEAGIDAQTGNKWTEGDLVDLGGMAFQGKARVTGEPFQAVRIDMPSSVAMFSTGGGEAELTDFRTDLPSLPMLDADGVLEFSFGGRLVTRKAGSGNYRARIPIRVDYN